MLNPEKVVVIVFIPMYNAGPGKGRGNRFYTNVLLMFVVPESFKLSVENPHTDL